MLSGPYRGGHSHAEEGTFSRPGKGSKEGALEQRRKITALVGQAVTLSPPGGTRRRDGVSKVGR